MRSAHLVLLLPLALAGCGLANGLSEGAVRSPLADVLGGEGEDEGCDEDGDCLADEQVCDIAEGATSGSCASPSVWEWCALARSLPRRDPSGPILYGSFLDQATPPCVTLQLQFHDPDGDFPTSAADLEATVLVRTDRELPAADTVSEVQLEDNDASDGVLRALVCNASTPTTVAISFEDDAGNRSNPTCAD